MVKNRNNLLPAIITILYTLIIVQDLSAQKASDSRSVTGVSPNHRVITAVRIETPPKIDGKLDDAVWQKALFQGDFLQREPNEGAPASEKTEIGILYDDKNIYFGARCYDSEPDQIRGTEMRRDASPGRDDYFDIVLDTFHDKRSAFFFTTTPAGGRLDGSISEDGKIDNRDWDGVWTAKTSIDDKGWYVEVAIPLKTLRFKEGGETVWGAHFVRRIIRKNEEAFWRLVPRWAGRLGQNRISEAGEIHGLTGLKMGGNIEFKPYAMGGLQNDADTDNQTVERGEIGIDLKWNVTSTLTTDFTYNTDFAQVEADQERVNLTRFSLFFPEKREFFLEGAETFAFGSEGINPYRAQAGSIQLFHSRKIGIADGNLVPIIGGVRLNGKAASNTTVGFLSIQSERTKTDDDTGTIFPETNYSVFRVKQNILSRSSVGFMFLNKQESADLFNRSFGFDSNINVSDKFSIFGAGAATYSPEGNGYSGYNRNNFAGNIGFKWESDLWQYNAYFLDIEKMFNPEMGYIRRTDLKRTNASLTYSPRPERWKSVRKLNYNVNGYYQTDHTNNLLNRKVSGSFSVNFQNTANMRASVDHEYEYLDFDWEVRNGLVIPIGRYSSTSGRISYSTSRAHAVGGSVNMNGGDYFTGNRFGGGFSANLQAGRIIANINYGYNRIKLPDGQFHTNTLSARISYMFNPDLYVKAYLQWYDDALLNDGRDRFSGNIIMRYTYFLGSDFYFVINQQSLIGPGADVLQNRTVLAKLTYFLRK